MGYYELKKSETAVKQKYYFVLKASNGQTIVVSEMYTSKHAALNGISSVQQNGSTMDIRDKG